MLIIQIRFEIQSLHLIKIKSGLKSYGAFSKISQVRVRFHVAFLVVLVVTLTG